MSFSSAMDIHVVMRMVEPPDSNNSADDPCYGCHDAPPQPIKHLPLNIIILVAVLAGTFLLVSYVFFVRFSSNWIMSRRAAIQNSTTPDEVDDDDDDENGDPIHHIWYINTVGLEESVINSITVCKYNMGEGLIDGTDCSVCLGEFSDGDDVRLLPKCSHAFHVPCIDTWLRSHVNCPLCRAAVVCNTMNSSPENPNTEPLDVVDETQMGNPENDIMLGRNQSCRIERNLQEEEAEVEAGDQLGDIETGEHMLSPVVNCGFRGQSDLSDNHRLGGCATEMSNNEMVPVRRSVSMDFLPASLMRVTLADHFPIHSEGSSSAIATHSIMNKKSNPGELSRMKKTASNRNQCMLKMVSIYSKGAFLQRPVAMKRSFSAGCKFLLTRNRSRNTVLPL